MNTYKPANLLFLLLVASACAGGDEPALTELSDPVPTTTIEEIELAVSSDDDLQVEELQSQVAELRSEIVELREAIVGLQGVTPVVASEDLLPLLTDLSERFPEVATVWRMEWSTRRRWTRRLNPLSTFTTHSPEPALKWQNRPRSLAHACLGGVNRCFDSEI